MNFHIWSGFLFYGIAQGTLLSVAMLLSRRGQRPANFYLSALVFSWVLVMVPYYLIVVDAFYKAPKTVYAAALMISASGPLFYFYTKSILYPEYSPRLFKVLLAVFAPGIARLVNSVIKHPGDAALIDWATHIRGGGDIPHSADDLIVPMINALYRIVFVALALWYVVRTERDLVRYSIAGAKKHVLWLKCLSVMLMTDIGLDVASFAIIISQGRFWMELDLSVMLVQCVIVQSVAFSVFLVPEAFFEALGELSVKKRRREMDAATAGELIGYLEHHMERDKPFKTENLRIADVAARLSVPSHQLSQAINEKLNVNFADLVNKYRVDEAKTILADKDSDQYTLVAVAREAGFNSKASFNRAFQKHAGMSPSEYRSRCRTSVPWKPNPEQQGA